MNRFNLFLRRMRFALILAGILPQFVPAALAQSPLLKVEIVQPANGAVINVGSADTWSVQIAAAVGGGPGLVVVEFFGDGQTLGTTTGDPSSLSPINPFQLEWKNPAPGEHTLSAMAIAADGIGALSGLTTFKVVRTSDPLPGSVSVSALKKEASEVGDSKTRTLLFEFRRHGGAAVLPMIVFYDLGGTATPIADYVIPPFNAEEPPLPGDPTVPGIWRYVTIPVGQETAILPVVAHGDNLVEGDESVLVSVQAAPWSRPFNPLTDYLIGDPARAEGVIHDSPAPTASSLVITQPHDLQAFPGPGDIPIEAIAVDPKSVVNYVEFFANDKFIGDSAIVWDITPPAGSPIKHHFLWKGVTPGKYILTARMKDSADHEVVSAPVRIAVNFPIPGEVPVVSIETIDPEAAEPDPANIGIFQITRAGGDLTLPLKVHFKTDGSADRGIDYWLIPQSMFVPCPECDRPDIIIDGDTIEIPSGEKSVLMGVRGRSRTRRWKGGKCVAGPDPFFTTAATRPLIRRSRRRTWWGGFLRCETVIVEYTRRAAARPGSSLTAPKRANSSRPRRRPYHASRGVGSKRRFLAPGLLCRRPEGGEFGHRLHPASPAPGTTLTHEFLWEWGGSGRRVQADGPARWSATEPKSSSDPW
jgi:hypothetical protein